MSAALPMVGVRAVSAFAIGWRGLGRALREGRLRFALSAELVN